MEYSKENDGPANVNKTRAGTDVQTISNKLE